MTAAADTRGPTTGSLVWHLAVRWRSAADRAVAPFGLTHARYSALASLRRMGLAGASPTQAQLADYTGLQPMFVSKLVRALERDGLVERSTDPDDGRAVRLCTTARGATTADEAMGVVRDLDAELTAALGGPGSEPVRALTASIEMLLAAAPPDPNTTGVDP